MKLYKVTIQLYRSSHYFTSNFSVQWNIITPEEVLSSGMWGSFIMGGQRREAEVVDVSNENIFGAVFLLGKHTL